MSKAFGKPITEAAALPGKAKIPKKVTGMNTARKAIRSASPAADMRKPKVNVAGKFDINKRIPYKTIGKKISLGGMK